MCNAEIDTILEEIPSDADSIVSSDSDENLDIENLPIDILETDDIPISVEEEFAEWDSDDDIPLSTIQANILKNKFVWTNSTLHCRKCEPFLEVSGPNISDDIETPTDIFLQLFPVELIEHITFQTNLYALQKNGGNPNAFVATNFEEINVFLGINMLMGLKRLPSYRDYWSSRLELRDTYISSLMSRQRFDWLLSNVHINDNSAQPKKNRCKLR